MPIPPFVEGRLPRGPHPCSWQELEERFSVGERRQDLTITLRGFVETARDCGFAGLVVGGSFATDAPNPGDLDLIFITQKNIDRSKLSVSCAQLLVNDTAFNIRTGHNAQNCTDDQEVVESLIYALGLDCKTGKDRGMLLLRFI
jgi:hypothetical protein